MITTFELDLVRALAKQIAEKRVTVRHPDGSVMRPPVALVEALYDLIDTAEQTENVSSV